MAIQTIIFDFGNVLGFFSHLRAAQNLAAFGPPGTDADAILEFLFKTDLEPRFEVGELSSLQVLDKLRETFRLTGTDAELALASADMFTRNPAVCDLIPRLAGRYRLLLLSNTNDLHYRHFRREYADVLDRFDHLVVSHLVGHRKPDPAIYAHAQENAKCHARECLFIDDLPANVAAGEAWGWHTILYDRHPTDDLLARMADICPAFAA